MQSKNLVEGNIDITPLLRAYAELAQSIGQVDSKLERAGAIQLFEICFELIWKTLRRILLHRGKETNSPRTAFREAALEKLIVDAESWFGFVEMRNLTVHTYDEATAHKVFAEIPNFITAVGALLKDLGYAAGKN